MSTFTLVNFHNMIVRWLSNHPLMLHAMIIIAIVLVFALLAPSVAYAQPAIGGCGSPGC